MATVNEKHVSKCSEKSVLSTSTVSIIPEKDPFYSQVEGERQAEVQPEWKPSKQIKLIVVGQIFVVFAISLDLSILTTTLPVSFPSNIQAQHLTNVLGCRTGTQCRLNPIFLDRLIISPRKRRGATNHGGTG
jgi:hypothetical protein